MRTSTAHQPGRLPLLVRVATVVAGAALEALLEARVGQLADLPVLGVFLLGVLTAVVVAGAVARSSASRHGGDAGEATWRDVTSRPRVDALVLLWFGAALGVLVLDGLSVLGAVGLLVVIAMVVGVPDAVRRRRERSVALGAVPGSAVVAVEPVDLAVVRLKRWAQELDQPPPSLDRRALLVADAEGLVLRRAGRAPRRSSSEADVSTALRWPWHEVGLGVAPRRDHHGQAVVVLTLAPPSGAGGRRFEVTLAVRSDEGSTSEAAEAAVADLRSRRPARSAT